MKITGWCALHNHFVDTAKYRVQCSVSRKGKPCRWFTYKVPGHKKASRRKVEGRGSLKMER